MNKMSLDILLSLVEPSVRVVVVVLVEDPPVGLELPRTQDPSPQPPRDPGPSLPDPSPSDVLVPGWQPLGCSASDHKYEILKCEQIKQHLTLTIKTWCFNF